LKNALVIEPGDIKKILAEHFEVPENNVIKSQYSYTVILTDEKEKEENEDKG
jgi:hypothetical protein